MLNKLKLSDQAKTMLAIGLASATLLICAVIAKNLIGELSFNNRVLNKKNAAKKQLDANLATASILQTNFAALGGKEKLVIRALPDKVDYSGLAATMESLASASGVKLKTFGGAVLAGAAPSDTAGPIQFAFTADVEGKYASLLKFFESVQLSARPMKVDGFSMTGTGNATTASVKLTTFYQNPADLGDKTETVK